MERAATEKIAMRMAAAVLGCGLALALILISLPGAVSSPLPATVSFSVAPAGELEVTPPGPGPVLVAKSLLPGGRAATGAFRIRNQSGDRLSIGLRARPDSSALDGLARVRVGASGRPLADTTLQGLALHPIGLDLASGMAARLRLVVWIPKDVLSGYEGRLVHVSLAPEVRAIGGRE